MKDLNNGSMRPATSVSPTITSCSDDNAKEAMSNERHQQETTAKSSTSNSSSRSSNDDSSPTTTSSAEEIERQHRVAQAIVDGGFAFAERCIRTSEIPLSAKQQPVEDSKEQDHDSIPIWSSRGQVDVSALARLVQIGYNKNYNPSDVGNKEKSKVSKKKNGANSNNDRNAASSNEERRNYWSPETARTCNVEIGRPSHDAWGIPKIVLLFCDDFCQDLYEFPWWTEFEAAVSPILNVLDVPSSRIVRLLLASLPSGVTIPVHHDSGEWVKYTHRVHVPILVNDPSKILFRCGRTPESLQPIECCPGHVFEINNQAKHAVSNCDSDYRVHLILDYVDEAFFTVPKNQRIRLQPGERLVQTRRSIDRVACKGQRPTPTFMILGAQKAGTTFLFELIMEHPLIIRPKGGRRETHCLDWRWRDDLKTTEQRRAWCLEFYHKKELEWHPSCLTGDSTPSYLIDSARVIPRLKEVFPHPMKFLVMLRDPVKRAISHYAMATSGEGTEAQLQSRGKEWRTKTFEEVVMDDVIRMRDCGLLPYLEFHYEPGYEKRPEFWLGIAFDEELFGVYSGSVAEDEAWSRYLRKNVPLKTGSYGLVTRGMYELNLRPWLRAFDPKDFLVLKLERLQKDVSNSFLVEVWNHLGVPAINTVADASPKNAREYDPNLACAEVRTFLKKFYCLHTSQLIAVLKAKNASVPRSIEDNWDDRGDWEDHRP